MLVNGASLNRGVGPELGQRRLHALYVGDRLHPIGDGPGFIDELPEGMARDDHIRADPVHLAVQAGPVLVVLEIEEGAQDFFIDFLDRAGLKSRAVTCKNFILGVQNFVCVRAVKERGFCGAELAKRKL